MSAKVNWKQQINWKVFKRKYSHVICTKGETTI